jgi:hypothetical protein
MALNEVQMAPPAGMPAAEAPAGKLKIPDPVAKDPAVRLVLEQKIPGVIVPREKTYAQADAVGEHAQFIREKMGLEFYRAKDESVALFNPVVISQDEVVAADNAGKLMEIFPEYGELTGAAPSEGGETPVAAPAAGMVPPTPQGMPKAPAATVNKTQQGRLSNLVPPTPPGASNVLAGIQAKAI